MKIITIRVSDEGNNYEVSDEGNNYKCLTDEDNNYESV